MRATARHKQAERELHSRRTTVADEHRSAAQEREHRAEMAEQKARVAQQEAERERAEANLRNERATMHERGMADDELIDDSERDRFAGVANTATRRPRRRRPHDGRPRPRGRGPRRRPRRRRRPPRDRPTAGGATSAEYEQGRQDERRFERERITDDVRDSERTKR